jgi:CRP-like cAMP-binding protein
MALCAVLGTPAYDNCVMSGVDLNEFIFDHADIGYIFRELEKDRGRKGSGAGRREWMMPFSTSEDGTSGLVNGFLASLNAKDRDLLEPNLSRCHFKSGERLGDPSDRDRLIYFPLTLVAFVQFADRPCGIGMVGREGIVGLSALLDESPDAEMETTVLMDGGWALVISAGHMRRACLASPTLSLSLLGFLQSYSSQLGWMIRARDHGSFKQRLCAWLLMLHDRVDSDFLQVTHGGLAAQLGVRRASVTDTLHILEGEDCLRCSRGVICLTSRSLLSRCAGVSYDPPRMELKSNIFFSSETETSANKMEYLADAVR